LAWNEDLPLKSIGEKGADKMQSVCHFAKRAVCSMPTEASGDQI